MEANTEFIPGGTVTSPDGFHAGATYAGINKKAKHGFDLGILFSEVTAVAAALFTTNQVKAAPVILCQQRLHDGRATAIVINSGCANACTGEQGLVDAAEMTKLVADSLGLNPEDVLVASTGVIGERLLIELIKAGIANIALSQDGGHDFARAIMTTDTVPKETAVTSRIGELVFTIGGVAKGSGMIHPDMATMLCFLTTDAAVELDFLRSALRKAVDISFNMVSIDGDTSPNDMVLIMANGRARNKPFSQGSEESSIFQSALDRVCIYLAKSIAGDGEGATKLIEVTVDGAMREDEARLAARTVVSSPLVKAAVHGSDPNWGRIIAAAGRSGAKLVEAKVDLHIGNIHLVKGGQPLPFSKQSVVQILAGSEVPIRLNLNQGTAKATAWGCDLSEEYVTINSQYTT